MKILLLTTGFQIGGTERAMARLAMGLKDRGFGVRAACLEPDGPIGEALRADGIPTEALGVRRALGAPFAILRLARHLRREKPAILQTFLHHANMAGAAATLLARPLGFRGALVTSLRTATHGGTFGARLEGRLTRAAAARTVCVSAAARRYALARLGLDPARAPVVPNGVPLDGPQAAPDAPGRPWVSVTRLAADKRPEQVVAAWRALGRRSRPAPSLEIAGGGPRYAEIERAARQGPITLLGERSDIPALLAGAAGFVLAASPAEGCPNAVLEAMAAGLPIVATAAGGVPEIVDDGETGLLAPPGDAEALAAAVARLDADPNLRRRLGAAARLAAERRFSTGAMADRYAAIYRSLLPAGAAEGSP